MKQARQEVRNLILMFGGVIFAAFVVVAALVFSFGGTGTQLGKSCLISPKDLNRIVFIDHSSSNPSGKRCVFDRLECVYVCAVGAPPVHFRLPISYYTTWYQQVKGVRSLSSVSEDIKQQFETSIVSTLNVYAYLHTPLGISEEERIVQRIEFLQKGELFRVQLKDSTHGQPDWVYFQHSDVFPFESFLGCVVSA